MFIVICFQFESANSGHKSAVITIDKHKIFHFHLKLMNEKDCYYCQVQWHLIVTINAPIAKHLRLSTLRVYDCMRANGRSVTVTISVGYCRLLQASLYFLSYFQAMKQSPRTVPRSWIASKTLTFQFEFTNKLGRLFQLSKNQMFIFIEVIK